MISTMRQIPAKKRTIQERFCGIGKPQGEQYVMLSHSPAAPNARQMSNAAFPPE
jgi:hypothetical protein